MNWVGSTMALPGVGHSIDCRYKYPGGVMSVIVAPTYMWIFTPTDIYIGIYIYSGIDKNTVGVNRFDWFLEIQLLSVNNASASFWRMALNMKSINWIMMKFTDTVRIEVRINVVLVGLITFLQHLLLIVVHSTRPVDSPCKTMMTWKLNVIELYCKGWDVKSSFVVVTVDELWLYSDDWWCQRDSIHLRIRV